MVDGDAGEGECALDGIGDLLDVTVDEEFDSPLVPSVGEGGGDVLDDQVTAITPGNRAVLDVPPNGRPRHRVRPRLSLFAAARRAFGVGHLVAG